MGLLDHMVALFLVFFFIIISYLFGCLVTACGVYFPNQGSNPGTLHWECGGPVTGLQGKGPSDHFLKTISKRQKNEGIP